MKDSKSFYCISISYKKADVSLREKFTLSQTQLENMLEDAKNSVVEGLMALSTCNRTELYGFANHPFEIISLLLKQNNRPVEELRAIADIKKNNEAAKHLMKVSCGLESQIIGDFEIAGQIKKAYKATQKYNLVHPYLDRLVNTSLKTSKFVKNNTQFSDGASSVAYAAANYILHKHQNLSQSRILIVGLGKIGRNTCENILKHTGVKSITVTNRDFEKAKDYAIKDSLVFAVPFSQLNDQILKSDIIITATSSESYLINKETPLPTHSQLFIDLSIPRNISPEIKKLENKNLLDVDELSKIVIKNIEQRKKHIPLVEEIIDNHLQELDKWMDERKYTPAIQNIKENISFIFQQEIKKHKKQNGIAPEKDIQEFSNQVIKKLTSKIASHLKSKEINTEDSLMVLENVFEKNRKLPNE